MRSGFVQRARFNIRVPRKHFKVLTPQPGEVRLREADDARIPVGRIAHEPIDARQTIVQRLCDSWRRQANDH